MAEEFIMIAGDVYYSRSIVLQTEYCIDNIEMGSREISFAELPSIYNITVQYEKIRGNAIEVVDDLFCMTAKSTEMKVRDHNNVYMSSFHYKEVLQRTFLFIT